jgi:hypothetical protein
LIHHERTKYLKDHRGVALFCQRVAIAHRHEQLLDRDRLKNPAFRMISKIVLTLPSSACSTSDKSVSFVIIVQSQDGFWATFLLTDGILP